jgi:predicted nuclease of predicted toxin-antitoxin system
MAYGTEQNHFIRIGKATDPDKVIFEYAKRHGFVVFTHDLDFGTILAATNAKAPSVFRFVVTTYSPRPLDQQY